MGWKEGVEQGSKRVRRAVDGCYCSILGVVELLKLVGVWAYAHFCSCSMVR